MNAQTSGPIPAAGPDALPAGDTGSFRNGVGVLWRYIKTHPKPFATAVTGSTIYSSMAVGGAVVLGRITDTVFEPAFEDGYVDSGTVWGTVAAVVIVAALRSVGVVTRRYYAAVTSRRMQVSLRTQITDHYIHAPLSFHRSKPTGELLAHADNDVEVAVEVINPLPFSLGLVLLIVFSVVALVVADPILAIVGLLVFPAMAGLNRYYTRRVEGPAEKTQQRIGDVSTIAHESYDGALVVKTLGLEEHEVHRLEAAAFRLRDARLEVGKLRAVFEPTLDALPNIGVIAILSVGGWRISSGALTTGDLVQVMALFTLLSFPMRVVGFLLEEMPRSVVALGRIDEVLATEITRDPINPVQLPDSPLSVSVEDLHFEFVVGEPVLDGCSFTLEAGEIVALVGATGSGKSTLCELLIGLVDADSGSIAIGGVPIERIGPAALRSQTALVFQESFLFADSVEENLTFGEVPLTATERAVRLAQADRFIANLDAGYQTVLGERGVTLSGGQRQRAALARALVRNPRLLILDDATSAVDPSVEARILDGLKAELQTTALIVAHRVSTIALADRVLFLRDGVIAATGSHAELVATEPDYAAMVQAYEADVAVENGDDDH